MPILSSKPPASNLHGYLSKAALPEMKIQGAAGRAPPKMPTAGHKSHRNLLHVRPEEWRQLGSVFKLKKSLFSKATLTYQQQLPSTSVPSSRDQENGLFCVDAPGFETRALTLMRPSTLNKIVNWVELIVLHTAQSTLRTAFPITQQWYFNSDDDHNRDVDSSRLKPITWVNMNAEATPDGYESNLNALMIFVQPPWILSPEDFRLLTSRRNVSAVCKNPRDKSQIMKSSERVWAKLWDSCMTAGCRWFVITSYNEWAFGVFSSGGTVAFISAPVDYNCSKPTVLQCLTYWMMSSIGAPGGFVVPEAAEPLRNATNLIPTTNPRKIIQYHASQIDSDSEWEGQDDDDAKSLHASEWGARSDATVTATPLDTDMPGTWNETPICIINTHTPTEVGQVPLIDAVERIEEWRTNPLVPHMGPQAIRVRQRIEYVYGDEESSADGSEWSSQAPSMCMEEGFFVKMQPKENDAPNMGGLIEGGETQGYEGAIATSSKWAKGSVDEGQ